MEKRSRMLRGTLMDGEARFFLCDTTNMTREARAIHKASATCTAALGRILSAAAVLGCGLKRAEDRVTINVNGGGPAGALCAVARYGGTVKATIAHPEVELPLRKDGKLDVGGAVGKDGQFSVVRSYGFGQPYTGRTALVSGEIAEDMAMYYLESEQIPSLCALGVRMSGENVEAAGGIVIQAMPACSEKLLDDLEIRVELFGSISQLIHEMTLEEIVEGCFRGLKPSVLEEMRLTLECDCSRDYIERMLLSMGTKELESMAEEQDGCEVCCHFCGKKYAFTRQELLDLIREGNGHGEN